MARITLNLDASLLEELKRIQKEEQMRLDELVSRLLAEALAGRSRCESSPREFRWVARAMGARVDISKKGDLNAVLDEGSD